MSNEIIWRDIQLASVNNAIHQFNTEYTVKPDTHPNALASQLIVQDNSELPRLKRHFSQQTYEWKFQYK